jgi:hypothetical protein
VRHFNDVKNWPEDIQKIAKLAENDKMELTLKELELQVGEKMALTTRI